MRPFHESEERGGVIQVDAGADSVPGDRGELHGLARLPSDPARQDLPERVFNNRRQCLPRVMGEASDRFQELIVESNGCAHAEKHIDEASICQAVAAADQTARLCPMPTDRCRRGTHEECGPESITPGNGDENQS